MSKFVGYLRREAVSQRQAVHKLASEEPYSDYMTYRNIIWTLPCLSAFVLYLNCQIWSAVCREQLSLTNTTTTVNWFNLMAWLIVCFPAIEISRISFFVNLLLLI